jgi:hypothetical protein
MSPQMCDRGVQISDIKANMVAADVAVPWDCFVVHLIFKQLDRRTIRKFQHSQLVYLGPRIYPKVLFHPVIV